jgi:hypothetical protein
LDGFSIGQSADRVTLMVMNKRLLVLAALAAAVAAYLKRPVKQPASTGVWGPADQRKAPH